MASSKSPWAIIAGVGPGIGASVARKFCASYRLVLLARKPASYEPLVKEIEAMGGTAIGVSADVSDGKSVKDAFETIQKSMGDAKLAAAIYNVGGTFSKTAFLELDQEGFEAGWKAGPLGAFHFSQGVLPMLLQATSLEHPPTLLFTSATAAMKGSAKCASYSTGKFALRSLAQSLAREFGPEGVHVAQTVVDGVIKSEETKDWSDKPDGLLSADAIADAYWYLHTQPRTNFTNELDLRPYCETW